MPRPYVVSVSSIASVIAANQGDYVDVPLPFHVVDDVIVLVCDYYPGPNQASVPSAPAGWTATSGITYNNADRDIRTGEGPDMKAASVWWWRRAVDSSTPTPRIVRPEPTGATDADCHLAGCAFVVRGCRTFGDPFESRVAAGGSSPAWLEAVTAGQADSLAIGLVVCPHSTVSQAGPSDQGYTTVASRFAFVGSGSAIVVLTLDVDAQTVPEGSSGWIGNDGSGTTPNTFGFVAIPAAGVGVGVQPSTTVPIRGQARDESGQLLLGCAEEYEVFITGPDYETRIDAVRFSSLEWERVLDDISTASVEVPDQFGGVSCCARFGGLRPWRYGITIERDGREIWKGPVTSINRSAASITVGASDALARFRRRLATRSESLRFVNNDSGQMFADLINIHARVSIDRWALQAPQPDTGVPVTRDVVAREFNLAWDVIKELLDSAVDAYVLAGALVAFQPGIGWIFVGPLDEQYILPGSYTAGGELVYGLFGAEAFAEVPSWGINGFQQANTAVVVGADSGEAGFRKYWTAAIDDDLDVDSVLDIVETTALYRPSEETEDVDDSAFQRRADSLVRLRATAPAVIESVSLSQRAPINVDHLRPGAIWRLDVWDNCWGQLLQAARVKRVKGSVKRDGATLTESVSASLYPLGYTEGDL